MSERLQSHFCVNKKKSRQCKFAAAVINIKLSTGFLQTSHTLGFTLYLLARNPDAQAKLQAEVDSVLGGHEGPLLPKHMAQFSYMKGVIKETLRYGLFFICSYIYFLGLDDDVFQELRRGKEHTHLIALKSQSIHLSQELKEYIC